MSRNSRKRLESDISCNICCKDISIYSFGECNHAVCCECSTRMRVLCQENYCPVCRSNLAKVVFAVSVRPFEKVDVRHLAQDRKYGVYFSDDGVAQAFRDLLSHRCHVCDDRRPERSFAALRDHMRREHDLFYCDICVEHLKMFSHERKAYTRKQLAMHRRCGDADDLSYKGHPLCEFCDERYLDNDELYRHLRREHYFCHFCDADGHYKYYSDYTVLREHFRAEHHLCEEGDCIDEKFTSAFRSDIDLRAHRMGHHSKNMTKAEARQARTLELEFTFTRNRPNGRDFEEVSRAESRGRGGQRSRNAYRGRSSDTRSDRYANRQENYRPSDRAKETEDIELALAASISDQKNVPKHDDFPALGGEAAAPPVPRQDPSLEKKKKQAVETIAKRLAKVNKYTVKEDDDPDFPALGGAGGAASAPSAPSGGLASLADWITTTSSTNSSRAPKEAAFPLAPWQLAPRKFSADEFPALGGAASSTHNGHPQQQQQQPQQQQQQHQQPTTTTRGKPPASNAAVRGKPPKVGWQTKQHSLDMKAEDFPPLGGASASASAVAPQHNNNTKVRRMSADHGADHASAAVPPGSAGLVRKNRPPGLKLRLSTSQENLAGDDADSRPSIASQDDFPKLPPAAARPRFARSISVQLSPTSENFPAMITITTPPAATTKRDAPPGFARSRPAMPAPPGFGGTVTITSTPALIVTAGGADTLASCGGGGGAHAYAQPPAYAARNHALIASVRAALDGDAARFDAFKTMSGGFRRGAVPAHEYYAQCVALFGAVHFRDIVPELLVLLPNIARQQELLAAHNRHLSAQRGGRAPNVSRARFAICSTCRQVLADRDVTMHQSSHSLDADFPALSVR
ncbi:PREDICTED: zinc finger protein 598-like [Priapulus caudatus]|uniref:RING-type E3 ubiquitin transferase n=1 Tax=Priapulus caudatus TaxID=37621 RepID=A0ABM1F9R6_PRICU|nr:PREDICTED: zinc finger protein 598-like [Priapulus caudatus]